MKKKIIIAIAVIVILAAGGFFYMNPAGETVFIGGLQLRILRTTRSRIELARVKKL